jgi:hypothetical protein
VTGSIDDCRLPVADLADWRLRIEIGDCRLGLQDFGQINHHLQSTIINPIDNHQSNRQSAIPIDKQQSQSSIDNHKIGNRQPAIGNRRWRCFPLHSSTI